MPVLTGAMVSMKMVLPVRWRFAGTSAKLSETGCKPPYSARRRRFVTVPNAHLLTCTLRIGTVTGLALEQNLGFGKRFGYHFQSECEPKLMWTGDFLLEFYV